VEKFRGRRWSSIFTPIPHLGSPPDAQELAILECIDGDVELDMPSPAREMKAADFGKLDAGLDKPRRGQGRLLPLADLLEEVPKTKSCFFRRAERQETRCAVVPDLVASLRMAEEEHSEGR
jgi:hypothetical protein